MAHELRGRVWLLPDDIDTGQILPHAALADVDELDPGEHLFEEVAPGLAERLSPGDILWAGTNFGQGSSREDGPRLLKNVGIRLVLATSFARIFYRNAINIGLPVAVAESGETKDGDEIEVNLVSGEIRNRTREITLRAEPLPSAVRTILTEGGLLEFVRQHGQLQRADESAPRRSES